MPPYCCAWGKCPRRPALGTALYQSFFCFLVLTSLMNFFWSIWNTDKVPKCIFLSQVLCATPQKSALKSALLTLFRPPTWRSCARCGSTSFRWTSTLASLWSAAPTMTTPGWPSPMTSWSTIRQLETPSWITRCLFKFPKTNLKQFISWTSTSGGNWDA